MTETHDMINALRRQLTTLTELLGLAADCGKWDTHAKYKTQRREVSGVLHGAIDAALADGTLSREDAARALSPIVSLETAGVF